MKEIQSHTSLRGIAALLVVFYHYRITLPDSFSPDRYTGFFANSDKLVDFFFLLSGFVIAYVYIEAAAAGRLMWRNYFRSRFARLYPLHLLTLFWMSALFLYSGKDDVTGLAVPFVNNLLLVHAWGLQDTYILNFPSWSISGETAAYLVFPFVVFGLARLTHRIWPVFLIIISFAIIALHEYLVAHGVMAWEQIALMRAVPGFAIGVALYRLRDVSMHISETTLTVFQYVAVVALCVGLHLGVNLVWIIPIFAVLIVITWEDRGKVARALSIAPLRHLGLLSYTIYMTHIPVRATGYYVWPKLAGGLPETLSKTLFVVTCAFGTLAVSWALYRFFEMPLRDSLRQRSASPAS